MRSKTSSAGDSAATKTQIKKDDQGQPADVILAEHIVSIDTNIKRLLGGPLKRETIVLLLHDSTKVTRRDINAVLNGLDSLRKQYVK